MPSSGGQTCALRSEEHTSELQSHDNLVCRLLVEKNSRRNGRRDLAVGGLRGHPRGAVRALGLRPALPAARPVEWALCPELRRFLFFFLIVAPPTDLPLFPPPPPLPV